jgi:hypothetical protein
MSPVEILAILAITVYAIFKQTQISEVREKGRFKLALIYGIVGLSVGGFARPEGTTAWTLLAISILLSVVVGVARGYLTRLWTEPTGQVMRQGTVLTVSLFVGLIIAKFGMGTFAFLDHVQDGAGFGEVMIMIAIMIVVQAEIVWRRAQTLSTTTSNTYGVRSTQPSL